VLKWGINAENRRFTPPKRLKMSICGGSLPNKITISISGSLSMIFIEVLHKNAEEINGM
jgi:hypothetical protein